MTKKQNTLVFILVGTLVSVVMTLSLAFIFLVLIVLLFKNNEYIISIAPFVSIIGAMILSMFLYQKLVNWAAKKFNLEDKLDPIFYRNKLKKNKK